MIDVGPGAGQNGGEIVFAGSYPELLPGRYLTGKAMRQVLPIKETLRQAREACRSGGGMSPQPEVWMWISLGIMTVVTGVAGSGKSTLISRVFANSMRAIS